VQARGAGERIQGRVSATARVSRRGATRREPEQDPDRHDHHGDAVGVVSRRGRAGGGRGRRDLVVEPSGAEHHPAGAKAGGNYLSGQLIAMEADRLGYHEGIALDVDGTVSERSGENIFVIRDAVIVTPPAASSILPGITRDTLIVLAKEHGYEARQERIPREMPYMADEVFFTGTAAEVPPVRSVDRIQMGVGQRGLITEVLQKAFFDSVKGVREDRYGWLTGI
jgi:branched-subunit amino acid aminotransferase/4-amino-4-deoxychorismate lyase